MERDKRKIEQAILTMDERKKDTIMKAHQQVTRDFGSIFGTLLPGSNAELKAPQGKTVLDGLEVSVLIFTISKLLLLYILGESMFRWSLERQFNRIKWRSKISSSIIVNSFNFIV